MTDDAQKADDAQKEQPPATSAAAELAAEVGVDLAQIEGSGTEGRILKEDVAAADPAHIARTQAGEKMPAGRRPSESGDPIVHQMIGNRQAHYMMGDDDAVKAIDDQLEALGYEL